MREKFSRLSKADPVLGVDMSSTGEVGCIGDDYYDAVLKAMLSVGYRIPGSNVMLSTGPMKDKLELLNSAKLMVNKGINLFATRGSHDFLQANGIFSTLLHWPDENKTPYSITQGTFELTTAYPADDQITISAVIAAEVKTAGFDS